jgi:hypothetical protein
MRRGCRPTPKPRDLSACGARERQLIQTKGFPAFRWSPGYGRRVRPNAATSGRRSQFVKVCNSLEQFSYREDLFVVDKGLTYGSWLTDRCNVAGSIRTFLRLGCSGGWRDVGGVNTRQWPARGLGQGRPGGALPRTSGTSRTDGKRRDEATRTGSGSRTRYPIPPAGRRLSRSEDAKALRALPSR